ncbi:rhamnulokinase [Occallatibacter riparius]|uniref:FGGY family carbohydrate kinase n=1 Tax=Occallatibacter riparius TaxID=1002689 RepID=A0A9J7BIE9_9BACT|nr:FGGY-family carbohydrate kinase [Occallatibacter riparius]UWZ82479.1 FGGY family carbohydrate kinase [Occallatibacter riparius]
MSTKPARIAIDLGAESCRVSLLRWRGDTPQIELIHRLPNGPTHDGSSLRWPFDRIFAGLEEGLRKAADAAPEGVASIAVDGWAVDYVRLKAQGEPIANPFCYRDERTIATKERADQLISAASLFQKAGAQPLRINTLYQLMADPESGIDAHAPWVNLPEYVLHRLGGRRVAEYTNATHTGLVDIATGDWSHQLLDLFGIPADHLPPIVSTGTIVGRLNGPVAELPAFRSTQLVVPACHDTASAIAGIATDLDGTAYICSGTWSLVGTVVSSPIITEEALQAGYTNQGAAAGGFCFHTNVNGMWILKQCLESWRQAGRAWEISALIAQAEECDCAGIIPVDAAPLMLDGDMPERLNDELRKIGCATIENCAGNEPKFARLIFESLASRYKSAIESLESMLGRPIRRIHILGGGSQNQLLTRLTAQHTGLPVETGNVESSTIGNFAVQLAAAESPNGKLTLESLRRWALVLSESSVRQ